MQLCDLSEKMCKRSMLSDAPIAQHFSILAIRIHRCLAYYCIGKCLSGRLGHGRGDEKKTRLDGRARETVGTDATMRRRQAAVRPPVAGQFLQDLLVLSLAPFILHYAFYAGRKGIASFTLALREVAIPPSVLPAGTPFEHRYGRRVTTLSFYISAPTYHPFPIPHFASTRRRTPSSIPFYPYSRIVPSPRPSLTRSSCRALLQKVDRLCFSVLNSRQISYGQRSLMRIWNSLE